VVTIQDRFSGGIPQMPPVPVLPWHLPDASGQPLAMSWSVLRELAPSAFAIAMLGAIESLLSAVVADGMKGTQHDPDVELVAQGVGNVLSPIFGGIAATGAIARTATNVRSGAISPIAAAFHALVVLAAVLVLAPLLGWLPMASLAALLLVVAWNMSEAAHFVHTVRVAPKSDVIVLLSCFSLTVLFDMVVAVSAGVMLAALLFMRRMAEVSNVRLVDSKHTGSGGEPMPKGVLVYEVAGPLFFGAAHKAMNVLSQVQKGVKAVVLDLRPVPAMDATGLVNLESALKRLKSAGVFVVIAGIQEQPLELIRRADWKEAEGVFAIRTSYQEGVDLARTYALSRPSIPPRTSIPPGMRSTPPPSSASVPPSKPTPPPSRPN
jgi:SulP family sulfate permease